ncbi:xanthine dehydrogenase family protein molybdopterin-binding subunit [Roseomonas sp. HF4]|uniref:xanthine dehydrogenase family protein molybdopterin-binding subunit n=1 Tax=Roseomonas sp. HF4 TaxID=2562313 RepID=UPI001F1042F7|nr:xanthine dehydrogenase family protein molybdopterin-binding subunit [Roseomonas sp. HF4]
MTYSGRSLRRVEDARFLSGQGRYVADIDAAGALHAVVLRSPHAHAAIRAVDTRAVRDAMVLTAADLDGEGIGPLPCVSVLASVRPMSVPDRPVLARGRVRHVGQPVAFVLAETEAAARDAAEAIEVDYDPLPAVVDGAAALAPGAPQIWPEAPGNEAFRFEKGDRAAIDAAFAAAARIVSLDLFNNRVHALPLEPRACLARFADGRFDLTYTGMGVHGARRQLASIFGLPEAAFHLSCPDVGGGFGAKNLVFAEYVAALAAARRTGRPVRWVAGASEEFAASVHGRDLRARARLALDAAGRFTGLEVETVAAMGAYLSAVGPHCPTNAFSTAMGGVYAIPAMHLVVRGAFTNTLPVDAYRGAGKPEANYIVERLVDAAARELHTDPAALRALNMMADAPGVTAMGMKVDGGRFGANLEVLARASDAEGFPARRAEAATRGALLGRGVACFLETARGAPGEWASARIDPDGSAIIAVGTHSNGQGHETSFPQVAADRLGLAIDRVRFLQADTDLLSNGHGHGGARSLHMGGHALVLAVDALLARARAIAAHLLQSDPAELTFAEGRFVVRGSDRFVDLAGIARAAADPASLPEGMEPGLLAEAHNASDLVTFPNGCQAAEVEIDRDTGLARLTRYTAVDDYGRLVNPLVTAGQVQGGLAQGIGQALLEDIVYDCDSGQLLTGSLMDYALPRADDLPDLDVLLEGTPTAANPLGVKGVGQAGAIAAPQVVMNAIADALAAVGATPPDMPATPEKLWRALNP